MEKQKRVLAYKMAQTMDNEELARISGGSDDKGTLRKTFKFTGVHGHDVEFDMAND